MQYLRNKAGRQKLLKQMLKCTNVLKQICFYLPELFTARACKNTEDESEGH